ncbi:hypothetical protein WEN_01285 [Mycoplasma wenyonii str. Massachusetts]|uniref:Uncharacterized protein n=1 Tax=Mycoplasma wenyonii (strain Massachusetts) TaxID=1197325 RepID=I6YAR4_MYCWM|nr:hypothetical protein [Mycoplasma wenyonii]AFN65056.1 hypothetical protein WEN_01285 [Mycoplasma wenyonii str. Massachusetts]
MRQFGTWFRDFFLVSLSSLEGEKESIDLEKTKVKLSWLFGASLYLSIGSFLLYIVGLSAIHLSAQIKDANWAEKIFYFMSPKVWQNYVTKGLFDGFRRAHNSGETAFIFINLGTLIVSFISLVFNLSTINLSWQTNLRELRLSCYALCFPVFGCIFSLLVIGYFQLVCSKESILSWFGGRQHMNKLWGKAAEIIEKVGVKKEEFKPKTLDFLELKKENKVTEILSRLDKYVIRKI